MKERPILFSAPMVRALLAGTKTQTRRAINPQFLPDCIPTEMSATNERGHQISGHSGRWWCDIESNPEEAIRCPFGQPGDRLWVRETHAPREDCHGAWQRSMADRFNRMLPGELCYAADRNSTDWVGKWRPSIHMPRWASRITLEVTDVRVERLQDISEADAVAEGITGPHNVGYPAYRVPDDSKPRYSCATAAFETLWTQINGPDAWDANPWVWAITFQRIKP